MSCWITLESRSEGDNDAYLTSHNYEEMRELLGKATSTTYIQTKLKGSGAPLTFKATAIVSLVPDQLDPAHPHNKANR